MSRRGAMAGVLLVDAGLLASLVGLVALVRPIRAVGLGSRRRAAGLMAGGLALVVTGALLPARESVAAKSTSRLDQMVPRWQFAERHQTRVHAPASQVESAVRLVTAREIRLFRFLTWLRSPRLRGGTTPETILAPRPDRPILEVALGSGFQLLAEAPGELVIGTLVMVPAELSRLPAAERERLRAALTPERFATLADPGYAKAVMSFHWVEESGGWCRLTTETRVITTSPGARRRFGAYWRVIYPGSALIRRMWLRAIRERAESTAPSPSPPS